MTEPNQPCWMFIVDTDQYAGNFERPMVAWMTGHIGECEVGDYVANAARYELPPDFPEPLHFADEHGCSRPATIWPTPGFFNDGRGNHYRDEDGAGVGCYLGKRWPAYQSVMCAFEERPTDEHLALLAARARSYVNVAHEFDEPGNILGCRLVRYEVVRTESVAWSAAP